MNPINRETYYKAGKIILSAGIPVHHSAYDYFCLAVCMVAEDSSLLTVLTKTVYSDIAELRGCNAGNVQKNMHMALASAYKNQHEALQQFYLKASGRRFTRKPTPGEFIGLVVLILALERGDTF